MDTLLHGIRKRWAFIRSIDLKAWVFNTPPGKGISRLVLCAAVLIGSIMGTIRLGVLVYDTWGPVVIWSVIGIVVLGWITWACRGPVPMKNRG